MGRTDQSKIDRFLAGVERRALVTAELWTRDREEALDLVQDAMTAFVGRYASRPETEWGPLFQRVLHNRLADWHRREKVRRRWRQWLGRGADEDDEADPVQQAADPAGVTPELAVALGASMEALLAALGALPARQRQAVVLRVWEGCDVAATAAAMGCSDGSVKTHLSRGLAKLREVLEEHR